MPAKASVKSISLRKTLGSYFKAIGGVVYCHQFLNRQVEFALWFLVKGIPAHTSAMLAHVSNFEARVDLFSQLARMRFHDKKTVARIKSLVREMDAANGKRNDLIHGRWAGVSSHAGAQLIREKPRSEILDYKVIGYTPKQMDAVAKRLFTLARRVHKFSAFVWTANDREAKRPERLKQREKQSLSEDRRPSRKAQEHPLPPRSSRG
jgi:hypothetical protein